MLPELRECPSLPGSLTGQVMHRGRALELLVVDDGEPMPQVLDLAEKAVAALSELEAKAKLVAVRDLLTTYNEDWRHYGIVGENGSSIEVHDPELSSAEFQARLGLKGVTVTGSANIELCFSDGGMFAGHSVMVTSFDGIQFGNTYADLFG